MLIDTIDQQIATAMKTDKETCEVLKLIKCELVKAQKDGVEMTEVNEAKILLKMVAQRKDAFTIYIGAGREDLAAQEQKELDVLQQYAPAELTDEEISEYTLACVSAYILTKPEGYKLSMRDMRPLMQIVQDKYPTASGKVISKTFQDFLKS